MYCVLKMCWNIFWYRIYNKTNIITVGPHEKNYFGKVGLEKCFGMQRITSALLVNKNQKRVKSFCIIKMKWICFHFGFWWAFKRMRGEVSPKTEEN